MQETEDPALPSHRAFGTKSAHEMRSVSPVRDTQRDWLAGTGFAHLLQALRKLFPVRALYGNFNLRIYTHREFLASDLGLVHRPGARNWVERVGD